MSYVKKVKRPVRLELTEVPANRHWMFKELPGTAFLAQTHEIVWLRKVLDGFERTCPISTDDEETTKETAKSLHSVLKILEYHGKPLERLLHLSEQYAPDKTLSPTGLFVRCPACHSALPKENVWLNEAAGQCLNCKLIFQVNDLKLRTKPKRSPIHVTEDETGLHLHQKPRHWNYLSFYLLTLLLFPALLLFPCWSFLTNEQWLQVLFSKEVYTGILLFFVCMMFLLCLSIRFYHVHRFVDISKETIRFGIRFFFWNYHWSVDRREMRAFQTPLFANLFGCISLSCGNRSFYLHATEAERDYLVSTVYRWLWANPHPHPNRVCEYLPEGEGTLGISIGGLGESENAWQMFCPHCGRQFSGSELDFKFRESALHCPACKQVFTITTMRRFMLEHVPYLSEEEQYALPERSGLHTEQTQEKITIEYVPVLTWKNILKVFSGEIFLTLLFAPMFLFLFFFDGDRIKMMIMTILFLYLYGPLLFTFLSKTLEHYDACRSLYASWSIQIDRYRLVIHRQYKGEQTAISYDCREIERLRRTECATGLLGNAPSPLWGHFPSVLGNTGFGGIELVFRDGTVEYLPCLPCSSTQKRRGDTEATCRWVNYANRFIAGQR
jgi:hypothetical protein